MAMIRLVVLLILFSTTISRAQVVEWARAMRSSGSNFGFGLAVDDGGNVISTGWFMGTVDFDPGASILNRTSLGGEDVYVQKLDANGILTWAVSLGSTGNDRGYDITTDRLGNVYVSGVFSGTMDFDPGPGVFNRTSQGAWDAFILKLDVAGTFVWAATFGGIGDDYGYAITHSDSGFVYTSGMFSSTVDFHPGTSTVSRSSAGGFDVFVHKMDNAGGFVWVQTFGGGSNDFSYSIQVDQAGDVYHGGYFSGTVDFDPGPGQLIQSVMGNNDAFVQKLTPAGSHRWTRFFAGIGNVFLHNLRYDAFNGLYCSGNFQFSVDFNPGPGVNTHQSEGAFDAFVVRLDTAGQYVWSRTFGGSGNDLAVAASPDRLGNVNIGGLFSEQVDMDPGPGIRMRISNGGYDVFVSKFTQTGNLLWNVTFGGTGSDETWEVAADLVGNVHTTGPFMNTVDFDPGPGVISYTSLGSTDIFVHKIRCGNVNTIRLTGCGSVVDPLTGAIYTRSDTIVDTLANQWECDSVVMRIFTVLPFPGSSQVQGNLNPTAFSLQLYQITNFNPSWQYSWQVVGGTIAAQSGNILNVNWGAAGTAGWVILRSQADSNCVRLDSFAVQVAAGTSVAENAWDALEVYPSPTKDYFFIPYAAADLQLRMFDLSGRPVALGVEWQGSQWQADVRHLAAGTYVLWMEEKDKRQYRLVQVLR